MKKVLLTVVLSLSLLSVGEVLVNPSEAKVVSKKVSKEELNKKLIEAINNNNIKLVKELLSKGANVNSQDNYGYTPIMFALQNESIKKEIVELLLLKGSDINYVKKDGDYKGFTPIMFALQNKNKEIIELIISKGADVNSFEQEGFTPLMYACIFQNKDIVELLISKGADINPIIKAEGDYKGYTPLLFALQKEDINKDIVELLVLKGADVNPIIKAEGDYKGYTPLIFACKDENKELAELLISKGADVNYVIKDGYYKGYTPLIYASSKENKELAELLVSKGADINYVIKDGYYKGYTPLIFSIERNNKEIEELLIKNLDSKSLENFEKNKKIIKLKANMHNIQTTIETYGVDWGGVYPNNIVNLKYEANSEGKMYWREVKNSFTGKSEIGKDGALMDYKIYKNYKPSSSLKGLVLYEAINPKFNKQENKSFCTKYKIYGTDENGNLLKDENGKIFFLTNI